MARKRKAVDGKRYVGQRIARVRKASQRRQIRWDVETGERFEETIPFTQDALGQRLMPYLGEAWTGRQVSDAERGKRALDAVELYAFSAVLRVPVGWFFELDPGQKEQEIEMPGPANVTLVNQQEWQKHLEEERHLWDQEALS